MFYLTKPQRSAAPSIVMQLQSFHQICYSFISDQYEDGDRYLKLIFSAQAKSQLCGRDVSVSR